MKEIVSTLEMFDGKLSLMDVMYFDIPFLNDLRRAKTALVKEAEELARARSKMKKK